MYKLLDKNYSPDIVISHRENIDSLKITEHLSRNLGLEVVAILQLLPFYGNEFRLRRIEEAINMYWALVTSVLKEFTLSDMVYHSYSRLVRPITDRFVWSYAKRLLLRFNVILAVSLSILLEMGDEWVGRIISFKGYGLDEWEIEFLLKLRTSSIESPKPYLVFSARLSIAKGVADLILASLLIKRSAPNFKLFITGFAADVLPALKGEGSPLEGRGFQL